MYWKKTINYLLNEKNKLEYKIISNCTDFNVQQRIINKNKNIELEEKLKFLENLENVKKKFKIKNEESIENWEPYKTKYNIIKKVNKKNIKKSIEISFFNIKKLINNIKLNIDNSSKIFIKYTYKFSFLDFNNIFDKYFNINKNKIILAIKKKNWCVSKPLFVVIDIRLLKTKIIFFTKENCISTMTNGLVFKKMQLNNKKYKKSEKLSYLSVKLIIFKLKNYINNRNIVVHIKGLKKYSKNLIKYFNQNINKNLNENKQLKIVYIYNHKIPNNTYFKFKKIKSIKRRLKKKMIKIK